MKHLSLLTFLFFFILNFTTVQAQDCVINPPITDDMFEEGDADCFGSSIIYTAEDLDAQSDEHSTIFGEPIDDVSFEDVEGIIDKDRTETNENMRDVVAGTFGDMSLEEIYECFDLGCPELVNNMQSQVDQLAFLFESISPEDIAEFQDSLIDDDPDLTFGDHVGDVNQFGGTVSSAITDIDLSVIIGQAFGIDPNDPNNSDCDNNIWNSELGGMLMRSSGKQFKRELEGKILERVEDFMMEDGGFTSDPNAFIGEIEGLGSLGSNPTPTPEATSVINAVNSSVDLYNGKGNFGMSLDDIGVKDISIPVGIGTTPGELKVDDYDGLLGSNTNLNAGGRITRMVKGLPDDFVGTTHGKAFGYKRGIKLVGEITGIGVGLDAKIRPKFLKRIVCKILSKVLEALGLGGAVSPPCPLSEESEGIIGEVTESEALQQAAESINEDVNSGIPVGPPIDLATLPGPSPTESPVLTLEFKYTPRNFNYVEINLKVKIPLPFGLELVITFPMRAGIKVVNVPSPVNLTTDCVGYQHLTSLSETSTFSYLGALDINNFSNLSPKEKNNYFRSQHDNQKKKDTEFFRPKSFAFFNLFNDIAEIFNINSGEALPRYQSKRLDLEPDEYYYDFGGYSGKFVIRPNGEIMTIPFVDFNASVIEGRDKEGNTIIAGFNFITPEGIAYKFNVPEYTTQNQYTLPTFMQYEGTQLLDRKNFKAPTLAVEEVMTYKGLMGIPIRIEKSKDFLTNYHINEGPEHISTWHVSNVKSKITAEEIDFNYRRTEANSNLRPMLLRKEIWKNGFADLTYSISEATINKPFLTSISNNRGKTAHFEYNKEKESIVGDKLLTRISVHKNNNFYKGWDFCYEVPGYQEIEVDCNENIISDTYEGAQGPAFSAPDELKFKFKTAPDKDNLRMVFQTYVTLSILDCIQFFIPIRLRFDMNKKQLNGYYFMDEISEFGSLLHLKEMLGIADGNEENRYQGEFIRNYLYEVKEILPENVGEDCTSETNPTIASFAYYGTQGNLPKRFSVNQDIWGYFNGRSRSKNPFISQDYNNIFGSSTSSSTQLGFYHEETGSLFESGRNWEAQADFATIGQLNTVTLETGAFHKYYYDLHEYPESSTLLNGISGGLRISGTDKGAGNGPTLALSYLYESPTIITEPKFLFQTNLDKYQNIEDKVTTSWQPSNNWQMNKSGYVGYGKVTEIYGGGVNESGSIESENGYVEHYFTNPTESGYEPIYPEMRNIHLTLRRPLNELGDNLESISDIQLNNLEAPWPEIQTKDWRLGLTLKSIVYSADGFRLQQTNNTFEFPQKMGDNGMMTYPKSTMYQYMDYGHWLEQWAEKEIVNHVDPRRCTDNIIILGIIKLFELLTDFVTDLKHPYKKIERSYPYGMVSLVSEAANLKKSTTYSYYEEGDDQSSITTNTYGGGINRNNLMSTYTSYNDGNNTRTTYRYANNANAYTSSAIRTKLRGVNYEIPLITNSYLNGVLIGGNAATIAAYGTGLNTRYLPEYSWSVIGGEFRLRGAIETYNSNGMPEVVKKARHGSGNSPEGYSYFEDDIELKWNNNLLRTEMTYGEFTTIYTYNNLCQLISEIDVNEIETTFKYDNRRRLEIRTGLNGIDTTTFSYVVNPLTITESTIFRDGTPEQGTTQYMDGWGNLLSTVRNDGTGLSGLVYDNLYRTVEEYTIGNGNVITEYLAAPIPRILRTTDAVDNQTSYEYLGKTSDGFGGLRITNPNGNQTTSWSDGLDRALLNISGEGGETRYTYDGLGRLSSVTNPIQEVYTYGYNERSQLSTKTVPLAGTMSMWYDDRFRLTITQDAMGNLFSHEYDRYDRLLNTYFTDSGSGPSSNSELLTDEEAQQYFTYSNVLSNIYDLDHTWLQRSVETIFSNNGNDQTKISDFSINDLGWVTGMEINYPQGTVGVSKTYNDAGLIETNSKTIKGQTFIHRTEFDEVLRPKEFWLRSPSQADQLISRLVYDDQDRVEKKYLGDTPSGFLQGISYGYDAAGKLIRINNPGNVSCLAGNTLCDFTGSFSFSLFISSPKDCQYLRGIYIDGVYHQLTEPIRLTDTSLNLEEIAAAIETLIHSRGFTGEVEIGRTSIRRGEITLSFIISSSNAGEITLSVDHCEIPLDTDNCCTIPEENGGGTLENPVTTSALFYEGITYDHLNISNINISNGCRIGQMSYDYTYDSDHRLSTMQAIVSSLEFPQADYASTYSYDLAGNLTNLTRQGLLNDQDGVFTFGEIDNLAYNYPDNSSELTSVIDGSQSPRGFTKPASGYVYDANGNMINDSGKGITIDYNPLNLPMLFTHSLGDIRLDYTIGGEKIKKEVTGEEPFTKDYLMGSEWKNGEIEAYYFGDGRVVFGESNSIYEYNLKDHLGNTVVTFSDKDDDDEISTLPEDEEVLRRTHYYPFGMTMDLPFLEDFNNPENDYLYNGKELNKDFEINLSDYGARWYDAAIGRWGGVDPLADDPSQVSWTPYHYTYNNPIKFIDPDGKSPVKGVLVVVKAVKKMHKARKKGKSFNVKEFLKKEGVDIADNVLTIFDDNAPYAEKAKALGELASGLDLRTNKGKRANKLFQKAHDLVDEMSGVPIVTADRVNSRQKHMKGRGRGGAQKRLRQIGTGILKHGKHIVGWIKQEIRQIRRGKRNNIRRPPGHELGHPPSRRAKDGFDHSHSDLQTVRGNRTRSRAERKQDKKNRNK